MSSDPPGREEEESATRAVDDALGTLPSYGVDIGERPPPGGVAGTVTTIAALLLGLRTWDRERVHHSRFPLSDVHDLIDRLLRLTAGAREEMGVPPGRSDVTAAGAVILDRVLRRSGATVLTVSDSDILDGIAWSLAG